jgi:hypothetical protein
LNAPDIAVQPTTSSVQILPVVTPAGLPRLPLILMVGYIVLSFGLFLVWPINWPIYRAEDWARLIGYVALCVLMIAAAAWTGSAGFTRVTAPLHRLTPLLVLGAAASLLLLAPTSYAYTGRPPWDVLDALRDQGAAYKTLQTHLTTTAGQHMGIALLRAVFAPLIYAVLPLGILRWREIGWIGRLALPATAAASVVFSLMRGTDKEIADLFVIGVSAAFVSYGRHWASTRSGLEVFRRHWRWGLAALVFVFLAQSLYTERKEARLNVAHVARTTVCANATNICADLDNPWIAWLPAHQRFGLTLFILSTCSGYYGLHLALDKPFQPAYGVGHSPVALAVYEAVTKDPAPHLRTYTYRNGENGWSEEHYWSSLPTWIANDVGFVGALPVLGVIGFLWGLWWREAAAGMSDPAAVLFALATGMMFYFPANNQLLLTPDGYAELAVWIPVWLWHRQGQRLLAGVITASPAWAS